MAPRSKEQFATIRQRSRKAILDAALHLFAWKGYRETTMDDIAARAGISKGLIYDHFRSKLVLLEELILQVFTTRMATLTGNSDEIDLHQGMEKFIRTWVQFIKTEPEFLRLFQQIHTNRDLARVLSRQHGKLYADLVSSITGFFARHKSPDPFVDAMLLGSIIDGFALNYMASPKLFPIDQLEERLVAIFTVAYR